MRILKISDLVLLSVAMMLAVACSPQFNSKKRTPAGKSTPGPVVVGPWKPGNFYDQHEAGGGALGTSASYRLSGVNIGQFGKGPANSAGFKVKGGAHGQLNQQ